jgi:hypothetical protein
VPRRSGPPGGGLPSHMASVGYLPTTTHAPSPPPHHTERRHSWPVRRSSHPSERATREKEKARRRSWPLHRPLLPYPRRACRLTTRRSPTTHRTASPGLVRGVHHPPAHAAAPLLGRRVPRSGGPDLRPRSAAQLPRPGIARNAIPLDAVQRLSPPFHDRRLS